MALSSLGAELPEWIKANYREKVAAGEPAERIAATVEQNGGSAHLAAYVRSLTVAEQAPPPRRSAPGRSKG